MSAFKRLLPDTSADRITGHESLLAIPVQHGGGNIIAVVKGGLTIWITKNFNSFHNNQTAESILTE